jgi:uracil-DNA glycosylase
VDGTLDQIVKSIRACRVCRDAPRYGGPLPHEPRPVIQASNKARICIAGQAPGARVHASGKPFTDASGVRLKAWLGVGDDVFYDAGQFAFVGMGFCFPGNDALGGDLPPRRECAEIWRERVFAHLPNIELMILIGRYAQKYHLGAEAKGGVTSAVERWREIYEARDHPRRISLPHPSWRNTGWLRRHAWFEKDLLPVLRAEVARLVG